MNPTTEPCDPCDPCVKILETIGWMLVENFEASSQFDWGLQKKRNVVKQQDIGDNIAWRTIKKDEYESKFCFGTAERELTEVEILMILRFWRIDDECS